MAKKKVEQGVKTSKNFLVLSGYGVIVTQPSVQRFNQIVFKDKQEKGTLEIREEVKLVSIRIERRIKNLSQQWFVWQKKNCVTYGLTEGGVGLRILPFHMKEEFLELMHHFEREYDEIQGELDKWAEGKATEEDEFTIDDVRKTLETKGKAERATSFNIRDIFEYDIFELTMNPVYLKEGKEEANRIAKKNAGWIAKSINKNLYDILEKIKKAGTTEYSPKPEVMLKALNEVKTQAEAWGVSEMYEEMFDIVDTSIHAVATDKQLTKEELEPIAKNLAKGLGIEYEGDPYSILDKIDYLKKGVTPREASFLENLGL